MGFVVKAALFVFSFFLLNCSAQTFTWEPLSPALPAGSQEGPGNRRRMTIDVTSPQSNEFLFFVFGGLREAPQSGRSNDLWRFDSRTQTWTELCSASTTAPGPRFDALGGYFRTIDAEYFVISTGDGEGEDYGDIWVCDLNGGQWTELDTNSPLRPRLRYGAAGGIYEGSFYISHGFSDVRYSDTLVFNILSGLNGGASWEVISDEISLFNPHAPHARCLMGTTIHHDVMYMYGGCANEGKTGGPCPAQDFWKFDLLLNKWERSTDGPVPLSFSDLASMRDHRRIVLYGGRVDEPQTITQTPERRASDLHIFDEATQEWTTYTANIPDSWDDDKITAWNRMTEIDFQLLSPINGLPVQLFMFGGTNQNFQGQIFGLVENGEGTAVVRDGWYYFSMVYLHGIFMFAGWGVFLQFGAFAFRYFKHHQSKWAWMAHRGAQSFGLLLAIIGFILSFYTNGDFQFGHARIGIAVMVLGVINPILAQLRCHPEGKNILGMGFGKRWIFNLLHHMIGRAALILALINIALGISMSHAPIGWWIAYMVWVAIIIFSYVVCEILRITKTIPRISRKKEEQYMCGFGDAMQKKDDDLTRCMDDPPSI